MRSGERVRALGQRWFAGGGSASVGGIGSGSGSGSGSGIVTRGGNGEAMGSSIERQRGSVVREREREGEMVSPGSSPRKAVPQRKGSIWDSLFQVDVMYQKSRKGSR